MNGFLGSLSEVPSKHRSVLMTTEQVIARREDILAKLISRTKIVGDCKLWTGAVGSHGYGLVYIPKYLEQTAHKASWIIHFGSIPEGKMVLHTCDTPTCWNFAHLFLGTHADNTEDMMRKGRHTPRTKGKGRSGIPYVMWRSENQKWQFYKNPSPRLKTPAIRSPYFSAPEEARQWGEERGLL